MSAIPVRRSGQFNSWMFKLRDSRARARIEIRLGRVERGLLGDVRPVGDGVSEMRIDYGPGYRLYFASHGAEMILLLCAGDKSTQSRDIAEAKELALRLP